MLRGVREEAREGAYMLVLEFETKEQMTFDMWESRQGKIQSFFGPGIIAEVQAPRTAVHAPIMLFLSSGVIWDCCSRAIFRLLGKPLALKLGACRS